MIQVFKPSIGKKEIKAVSEVLKSGWLGLGPRTAEFEKRFARFVGSKYAVGVNSGTAALHLALSVLDIGRSDEVIVPTISFVSTAHVVLYNGARPIFADVYEDTLCIDVNDIKKKITRKTKAIIPVHCYGHPCEMDQILALAKKKGRYVIEDAAHACGARYKGKRIGSLASDLTCFSFHAVKNLTCGEGGMITTNNKVFYEKLLRLRWLGISKDTWSRTETAKTYAWQYWVNELGFKAHLNDIASAIGMVQLERLEAMNSKRREIVKRYNRAFKDLRDIVTPVQKKYVQSSWHIYHVKVPDRDKLIGFLKTRGIAPGVHYYPIHMQPLYKRYKAKCPVAEKVWQNILSLPVYPDLKATQATKVIKTLKEFCAQTLLKEDYLFGLRIKLKKLESCDLERVRKWRNQNRHNFFTDKIITPDQQQAWFNTYIKKQNEKMYIIITKAREIPIGVISIYDIDFKKNIARIGRIIIGNKRYRGRGLAVDAVKAVLKFAFNMLKLKKISLEVFATNSRACRLYRRCGFRQESRRFIIRGDRRREVILMSISRIKI
ncbi:MAG: GNAT family N-acetyltransferase [Candidatus Omnitrophota bacterium]|nr:MAG: GNAT family N-acetyltransferase [Candidatus Omnitrophota bacterium]